MIDPITALAGFGLSAIGSIYATERNAATSRAINELNAETAKAINEQNIAFQRETNAQNERLMREAWLREDKAVQRRAADLKAAGINPLIAGGAGGAASTMAPVRLESPRAEMPPAAQGYVTENPLRELASLGMSLAQVDLIQSQAAKVVADTVVANKQAELLELEKPKTQAATEEIIAARRKIQAETEQIRKEWGLNGKPAFLHPKYASITNTALAVGSAALDRAVSGTKPSAGLEKALREKKKLTPAQEVELQKLRAVAGAR